MGFEYKIQLKKPLTDERKKELIALFENNPAFFRSYPLDTKTIHEFRLENNKDIEKMPDFQIEFEKDGIYLLITGSRNLSALTELKKALEDDIVKTSEL